MDSVMLSVDDRFPLSFYYRLANQILNQARVYRDEGNLAQLYQTLCRYSRLMSEIIPQHRCYSTYSSKDKLRHKKILQEVVKELEQLKPVSGRTSKETALRSKQRNNDSNLTQRVNTKDQDVAYYDAGKASCNSTVVMKSSRYNTNAIKGYVKLVPAIRIDKTHTRSSFPVALTAASDSNINVHVVEHHFPSPVLSCVESLPLVGHVSHINGTELTDDHSSCEGSSRSKAIQDVHISARLMEEFMELASANTKKNLETCGVLGAFLTHPSQTCFLSSIDLHTQYSYQVMLPEAIAIVMAPTDPTRSYGIFRLTDPGGIMVLKECRESGFHLHPETCSDGSPIYDNCSNVYINPNLRFEIIDLRSDPSS